MSARSGDRLLRLGDGLFDEDASLVLMPITGYGNRHTAHLDHSALRHPVRESLYYALALLADGSPDRVARAERILSRVVELQDAGESGESTRGLWAYFAEEPVGIAPSLDINWADFVGMGLSVAATRFPERLSSPLRGRVTDAVVAAAGFIRRRAVDLGYTNIAFKGTFVALVAAELAGDDDLLSWARSRLGRLRAMLDAHPVASEYNSPAYAGITLVVLHALDLVHDERARADAARLRAGLWREIARRFHAPTGELAGPHARAYAPRLADSPGWLGPLIEHVTDGDLTYPGDEGFDAVWPTVLDIDVDADVRKALLRREAPQREEVDDVLIDGSSATRRITTWLAATSCLGSVSFQDGWEQRDNVIAHWRSSEGGTGWLRHRYLHDDRPCCSGYVTARQQRDTVSVAAFIGAGADEHVLRPVDGVDARFLGTVIEVETAGEAMRAEVDGRGIGPGEHRLAIGGVLALRLTAVTIAFRLDEHRVSPGSTPDPRLILTPEHARIVLPHVEGERRRLRWRELDVAESRYTLRVAEGADATLSGAVPPAPTPGGVLTSSELEWWAGGLGV